MQTFFIRPLRLAPDFHSETPAPVVLSGAFDYDTIFSIPSSPKAFFLRLHQPTEPPPPGSATQPSFSAEPWIMTRFLTHSSNCPATFCGQRLTAAPCGLLAGKRLRPAGAERVDVEPAAARVARVHRQLGRLAAAPDVREHALGARLVELVVVAKAHDVARAGPPGRSAGRCSGSARCPSRAGRSPGSCS